MDGLGFWMEWGEGGMKGVRGWGGFKALVRQVKWGIELGKIWG